MMAVRNMGVMPCRFVVASLIMFGRFFVMPGGMSVVFGRFFVMLCTLVIRHTPSPVPLAVSSRRCVNVRDAKTGFWTQGITME